MSAYLTDLERKVLEQLCTGRPRHLEELVDELEEPRFAVRAALKKLKRERLIEEHLTARAHEWAITGRGLARVNADRQMRLA